jgi:alginate O-acetyltransferase complex protein AlgI
MLFNSYQFIFAFLPIVLIGFEIVGRLGSQRAAVGWLITCSVLFYGIWNPLSLALIAPSIAVNFALARWMQARMATGSSGNRAASWILAAGVAFNVCFLGYFKYKNFFLGSVNDLWGTHWTLTHVILPLGISFITFQKIAFLVDVRAGAIKRFDTLDFLIFVFFFPQLIAGPIVHYREMMPQFDVIARRLEASHLAVGLCLFAFGLFKKTVLADGIAPYATAIFTGAEQGQSIGLVNGWLGALAYTLQIYFDFSGYTDMAIGLARMFGIRLPANFNSPLKASSIIDFWGRWHMTLTRFLTAYVYTPIVMRLTRARIAKGKPVMARGSRNVTAFAVLVAWPTIATMGISGLWHGAGWTFILWGLLHGAYLIVNHGWRLWRPKWDKAIYERRMRPIGFALTFLAVVAAMVLFRARTLDGALRMLAAMVGLDGIALPDAVLTRLGPVGQWLTALGVAADLSSGATLLRTAAWVTALLIVALALPNSLEVMGRFEPALNFDAKAAAMRGGGTGVWSRLAASFEPRWAAVFGVLLALGVLSLNRISEFLYWQF